MVIFYDNNLSALDGLPIETSFSAFLQLIDIIPCSLLHFDLNLVDPSAQAAILPSFMDFLSNNIDLSLNIVLNLPLNCFQTQRYLPLIMIGFNLEAFIEFIQFGLQNVGPFQVIRTIKVQDPCLHFLHHLLLLLQPTFIFRKVFGVELGQLQEFPFKLLQISISMAIPLVFLIPLLDFTDLLLSISHSSIQLLYHISQSTFIDNGAILLLGRYSDGFPVAFKKISLKGAIIFVVARFALSSLLRKLIQGRILHEPAGIVNAKREKRDVLTFMHRPIDLTLFPLPSSRSANEATITDATYVSIHLWRSIYRGIDGWLRDRFRFEGIVFEIGWVIIGGFKEGVVVLSGVLLKGPITGCSAAD